MLRTGGFDMVGEINERFLNRLIGIFFYKGFLTIRGVYDIASQSIPNSLSEFTEIKYKISLKDPPNANLVDNGKILLLAYMDAVFTVLGGVELRFDVALSLKADFSFNSTNNR